jgi:hypothetical protein
VGGIELSPPLPPTHNTEIKLKLKTSSSIIHTKTRHVAKQLFFSDDFIQAQQQLARWASEDVVSVVVMESDSSGVDPSAVAMAQNIIHPHITSAQQQSQPIHPIMAQQQHQLHMTANMNGLGAIASRTPEFYHPSPPSTTETESSGSVMLTTQRRGIDVNGLGPQATESTGRYPEYKH